MREYRLDTMASASAPPVALDFQKMSVRAPRELSPAVVLTKR